MNFSKQLKKYRELNNLSQEVLAEKIYVTRQTISKWENDKTYPDIHNLIALSILFDISLDELVKGDVKVMKNEVSNTNIYFWTWSMGIFLILTPLSIGPTFRLWGLKGLWVTVVFIVWLMISCFKLEKIKKDNNLKTYSEILAFIEDKDQPRKEIVDLELKKINQWDSLVGILSAIIGIILIAISIILLNK